MFKYVIAIFITACFAVPAMTFAQAGSDVVVSSGGPILLWKKVFKTRIDKVAASADAKRLAVTVSPSCVDRPAPDDSYYLPMEGASQTPILRECKGGKLVYLNSKGQKLWEYPQKAMEGLIGVYNVVMSTDGKYLAASIIRKPCVLETRDETIGDNWEHEETPSQPAGSYRRPVKYMACKWDVVLLNSEGRALWTKEAKGFPKIAPDGSYVMMIPFAGRDLQEEMFEYGNSWYLFSREGKELFEKKVSTNTDIDEVVTLTEDKFSDGPISRDGRRMILANNVYEISGDTVTKLNLKLPVNTYLNSISPDGSTVRAITPEKWGNEGARQGHERLLYLIDVNGNTVLNEGANIFHPGTIHMRELLANELFPDFEIKGKSPVLSKYFINPKWIGRKYNVVLSEINTGKELAIWETLGGFGLHFFINKEKNLVLNGPERIAFHKLLSGRLMWLMTFKNNPLRRVYPLMDGRFIGISVDNTFVVYDNSRFVK